MAEVSCFLDSNIFMYAAGGVHAFKDPCVCILADVKAGRMKAAVNTEVLQELLYRYSKIGMSARAVELCRQVLALPLEVWSIEAEDIRIALSVFESLGPRGLEPRDAVHAASMQRHGVRVLLSADRVFDLLPGARPVPLIPPAAPTGRGRS